MNNVGCDKELFKIIVNNIKSDYYDKAASPEEILVNKMQDGSFSDLDYTGQSWTKWPPGTHISRVARLCKIYATPDNPSFADSRLKNEILSLIRYFIEGKFHSDNWWWNDVGVPTQCGIIRLLFQQELSPELDDEILRLFEGNPNRPRVFSYYSNDTVDGLRPYRSYSAHMFAQLVDTCVYLATVNGDASKSIKKIKTLMRAIEHELSTITWAEGKSPDKLSSQEESIKSDYSYHQHENGFLPNTYGSAIPENISTLLRFLKGTGITFSDYAAQQLANLILNGYRYTRYRGYSPMMLLGRDVGNSVSKSSFSKKLQDGFRIICEELTKRELPERNEIKIHMERMINPTQVPHFIGTKYFWHSDFLSHNRANYQFSVHGVSKRVKRPESALSKNVKGMYLGDGCYNIMLSGKEYDGLAPVLDWRKLPGVTSNLNISDEELNPECEIDKKIDPSRIYGGAHGTRSFAGGVSDGRYGFFSMEYEHLGIKAQKSWFCFDEAIVSLGANICAEKDAHAFTTLNQCRLESEVLVDGVVKNDGEKTYKHCKRVWHNGIGYYFFTEKDEVYLKNAESRGSWNEVDTDDGSNEKITEKIFLLGINHGKGCNAKEYSYIILPDITQNEFKNFQTQKTIKILENTKNIQAVWNKKKNLLQAVFYNKGVLKCCGLIIETDAPCAILLERSGSDFRLYCSNPNHEEAVVNVKLSGEFKENICFKFEKGFRYNNLGRPVCYDSEELFLPFSGAMGDE